MSKLTFTDISIPDQALLMLILTKPIKNIEMDAM